MIRSKRINYKCSCDALQRRGMPKKVLRLLKEHNSLCKPFKYMSTVLISRIAKYHIVASMVLPESRNKSPRTLYSLAADADEAAALALFRVPVGSSVELREGMVPGPRVDDRFNIVGGASLENDELDESPYAF